MATPQTPTPPAIAPVSSGAPELPEARLPDLLPPELHLPALSDMHPEKIIPPELLPEALLHASADPAKGLTLSAVLLFLLAAVVLIPLLRRLRVPSLLGYLLIGLAVGPVGLGMVDASEDIHILAEFGIVFLLFSVGLELSLDRIRQMGRQILGLGGLQFLGSAVLFFFAGYLLGWDPDTALVVAGALAMSSTAIVLQHLSERREMATPHGRATVSVLLLQDLMVLPMLVLVPVLGQSADVMAHALSVAAIKGLVAFLIILFLSRFVLRRLLQWAAHAHSPELFVGVALLAALGTAWIAHLAGLSMALGAFLAGLVLAGTEYRHQIDADLKPFKGLLLGLFFIAVGMSLNGEILLQRGDEVLLALAAILAVKALVLYPLCRRFFLDGPESAQATALLAGGGEFAFVLFTEASGSGIIPDALRQTLTAAVILSLGLTPVLVALVLKASRQRAAPARLATEPVTKLDEPVLLLGYGRVGEAAARLLSEAGQNWLALDDDPARVYKARALSLPVYFGDATRLATLKNLGVDNARVALITMNNPPAAEQIARLLREHFPGLPVIVRTYDVAHGRRVRALGVKDVVCETQEPSLQLAAAALRESGVAADTITELTQNMRARLLGAG